MKKPFNAGIFAAVLSLLLVGCASGPAYQPVASQTESIDMDAFAPKVEAFVVLLDISSSMGEDYQDRPKVQIAQDLVASFNATVPPADFKAGLVTFGNGSGRCLGRGEGKGVYGLEAYQTADFASALGSIECAGGTTPMSEGVDATAQMLSGQSGPVAVIIVSDFQWVAARDPLRSHGGSGENLCLHTVKVGDNTTGDALIASIANTPGCDSSVAAGDIASAGGMANYVTGVLLAPLEYEKHAVSATALFDFDKAVLKEQGKAELRNLAEYIKGKGITVADIDVIGHTDSMGSEEYNQDLSERRAMAVKEYLVSMGVVKGRASPLPATTQKRGGRRIAGSKSMWVLRA